MNVMNTYGYAVFRRMDRTPLHIVAIFSEIHIGFAVFDNALDAQNYIKYNCDNIKYNPDFDFVSGFGDLLQIYTTTDPKYFFRGTNNQLYIATERKV